MKRFQQIIFVLAIVFFASQNLLAQQTPRVFLLDGQKLKETRQKIKKGDKSFDAALSKIVSDAEKALRGGNFSVVNKAVVPPSGDKHDYMSQAPYFWKNPKTPDGLPYVRRDGERNPEINKIIDHQSQDKMISAVETLALAYYFKGDEKYAAKAVELLRVWFLDAATKMNPNLEFGQGIPGITTGRGIGLIETVGLTRVVDAIGLLEDSKSLTETDKKGLRDWFAKFLGWMQESKNGRDEAAAENNHGTHYDIQIASFALFLSKKDLAKSVLETAKQKRIAKQIEPDGRQPLELARTKAWSYSVMNLKGLMMLARLGENVGVDLWNYKSTDGRSIRAAIDFLYPFSTGEKWTYQQLGEWQPNILFPFLRRASTKYTDEKFKAMIARIPAAEPTDREVLIYTETGKMNQSAAR